jgi:hypothetical protein
MTIFFVFFLIFVSQYKKVGVSSFNDPDVDGRIILKWIFRKWDVVTWNGLIWLMIWTGGGHL